MKCPYDECPFKFLRQEFINHLRSAPNSLDVTVPDRSDFQSIPSTGKWVENDKEEFWNYSYDVLLDVSMRPLLEQLTNIVNRNIATTYTTDTAVEVQWPAGAVIEVTSGFRNPERNERVSGATGSRHMLGRALDVAIHHVEGEEKEIAYFILWEMLKDGLPDTADYVQYETKGAAMIKKINRAESNSAESNPALWNPANDLHPINGIADGFLEIDHLHLQDNP